MSMRCCSSSSIGGYFVIGVGAFVIGAGVMATQAFKTTEAADQTAAVVASPFTGQVITAGYTQPEDMEMDPGGMMEMMMEWGATTEEHKLLKNMAGEWDCTTSFSMGGPEPEESTGSSESRMVLGGRFVTTHFNMPDFMGMEFEGMGAAGYDKAKGKFVNVWMDNMNTGFTIMEGTYDEDTDTMTWTGDATVPAGPGETMTVPIQHIVKGISTDTTTMEFWRPNPMTGELMKSGTIVYTRR